jgi:predicted house-cleaning noncanonical NTP pyrophosphatase (MazG superfamily)
MLEKYNKLVRDHIPDIIRASGRQCGIETVHDDEFIKALHAKLVEEAQEIAVAPIEKLADEIADLYEVIDYLISIYGINEVQIRRMQKMKHSNNGGYEKRIRLLWIK